MNNWQSVWGRREVHDNGNDSPLEMLIELDGFDTPLGKMGEQDWIDYGLLLAGRIGIGEGDSIFEVGCGSGAFLYPFLLRGHVVAGLDFSRGLIDAAVCVIPEFRDKLLLAEAIDCPPAPMYDHVIANHVFHYFPTLAYAEEVFDRMVAKSGRTITLTALPDRELREQSEQARRGLLSEEEYNKKYEGLDILYFDKDRLRELAKNFDLQVMFHPHEMPGFAQNAFRFDAIFTKAGVI